MVVPPSQCKTWIFLLHNGRCYALPMVRFFYIFVLLSGFTWSAFLPFVLFQVLPGPLFYLFTFSKDLLMVRFFIFLYSYQVLPGPLFHER